MLHNNKIDKNKNINLASLPEPKLWEVLEKGLIDKPSDPLIYLEIRNLISDSLRKVKQRKNGCSFKWDKADIFGECIGFNPDDTPNEFIIGFGYKGMVVSLKGFIAKPTTSEVADDA
jgi:hypothetical protein